MTTYLAIDLGAKRSGMAWCTQAGLVEPLPTVDRGALEHELGKQVKLRHLSSDCHALLSKSGQIIIDSEDDPDYQLAVDYNVKTGAFASGH